MEEKLRMLAVIGAGGVGKTTLLRLIHDKLGSTGSYSFVIWVTVSEDFQIEKVQDEIWGRIFGSLDQKWVENSTEQKAKCIYHVLNQSNFVLFLDDLWNPIELLSVGVPDPRTQNESIVILSSRNRGICTPMGVQRDFTLNVLTVEAAWTLFQMKVGEDIINGHPDIIGVAKKISSLCFGVPIYLCTVAGAMARRKTYGEWEFALEVLGQDVQPYAREYLLLNFCYEFLPGDAVKFCFLYFSLFPEDFTIPKSDDLIDFWISEHFFGRYDGKGSALNLGCKIMEILVRANLFEEENVNCVKMLDLIRDFALGLIIKYNLNDFRLVTVTKNERDLELTRKILGAGRILSMKNIIWNTADVEPNLLGCFVQRNPFIMIKPKYKSELTVLDWSPFLMIKHKYKPELTVLDLSKSSIEELPQGISRLVSLQHLNLSHTYLERLPIELKELKKLRCLNLENNDQLRVIPRQVISSLSSLQVLRMFRCGFSVYSDEDDILSARSMDISELHSLESLKLLSITITCASALEDFFSTHILPSCTQALSLEVFWDSKSLDISSVAAMEDLRTLEIHYAEHLRDITVDIMMYTSFASLLEVNVKKCSNLHDLSWLILAPNLKILRVSSCLEIEELMCVEQLGEIQYQQHRNPLVKLEALELDNLQKLKSIYWEALPFQSLKKIQVVDCPLLRKLPLNANSVRGFASVIEDFEIIPEEDWWKQVEWEDCATEDRFSSCFEMLPVERKWSPPVLNLQPSSSYVVRSQSDEPRGCHQRFQQYFCCGHSGKLDG